MKTVTSVIYADLDEMVFENRERSYGAYFLRKSYYRNLSVAASVAFFIFLLFTFSPVIASYLGIEKTPADVPTTHNHEVVFDAIQTPKDEKEIIKPPEPPVIDRKDIKTTEFRIPEPTPDEKLNPEDEQNTILLMDSLELAKTLATFSQEGEDIEALFTDIEGGNGGIPDVVQPSEPDISIFVDVSEEPKAVNLNDISRLIGYPSTAQQVGISGTVVVRVLVDNRGNYQKHKVINSNHPILTSAVEKHVDKLKFTPAIQGNKPIAFWVNIPFNFRLVE